MSPLLELDAVSHRYPLPRQGWTLGREHRTAVDRVSLAIEAGEILGLVGESGCGKSTLGRIALGLQRPTEGGVRFRGTELHRMTRRDRARLMQMIYQHPMDALDPRWSAQSQVREPLALHQRGDRHQRDEMARRQLERVGLDAMLGERLPKALSGGQAQRVVIARALILEPSLLVLDEPVASLDISVQAQIIALLRTLSRDRSVAMLFISHDLRLVGAFADRIAVMKSGAIVECADAQTLFERPQASYTGELLDAIPALGTGPVSSGTRLRQIDKLAG